MWKFPHFFNPYLNIFLKFFVFTAPVDMNAVVDIRKQIEEVKTQIDLLQTRKNKLTEIFIHNIYVKQYPSRSSGRGRSAVKTCKEYIELVEGALAALQTGDPPIQENLVIKCYP